MGKNVADIKLTANSGIELPLPNPKDVKKVLILGNTIGFFGYPGEECNISNIHGEDAKRFAWMYNCALLGVEIEILGEIEEFEYYSDLFKKIKERYGLEADATFVEMKKNEDYDTALETYIDEMEDTGKKRFDFAIMNPPYANHIGEKILAKTLEISKHVTTIQPAAWLFGKRQNKNITKYADANGMEMTTISAVEATNAFAGTAFGNSVGIAYFGTNDGILYNGKKYNKCEEISFISDDPLLLEFKRIKNIILQNEKHNMETYMRREPNTLTFVNVPIEFSPNPNWWCMRVRSMIGNPGKIDFYTALSKDFKEQIGTYAEMSLKIFKMTNKGKDIAQEKKYMEYYYAFDDERTLLNLINYIQTDFFRGCLYIIKTSLHIDRGELRSIPWFDFTDPVFSKTPKEIDDYLFTKYNISNEIRKHLEELLPDYYGIRK